MRFSLAAVQSVIWAFSAVLFAEFLIRTLEIPNYLLPLPSRVLQHLWTTKETMLVHSATTFGEAGVGLVLATVGAAAIAIPASLFVSVRGPLSQILVLVQSTPVIALGPVLGAWMGPGFASKAVLSGLVCLPAMTATLLVGLSTCPRDELVLFQSMGASQLQQLRLVRLPRAVPALFTALTIGVPLSMLGAVVGEFVGASQGLGFVIMTASYYLRTDEMFAAIVVAAGGSLGVVSAVKMLRTRWSWERFEYEDAA